MATATASKQTHHLINTNTSSKLNNKNDDSNFNLQEYLSSKEGDEWLEKVEVKDLNNNSFRYYAPPVSWEDINRHNNCSYGDFIFDVTININDIQTYNSMTTNQNTIRYALRPQNMKDPIALQSTQEINLPIGNYNNNKLRNVKLIDILSNENLLKEIGIDCTLHSSLYE
eukprot:336097_1